MSDISIVMLTVFSIWAVDPYPKVQVHSFPLLGDVALVECTKAQKTIEKTWKKIGYEAKPTVICTVIQLPEIQVKGDDV